jgi:hypothetical protein
MYGELVVLYFHGRYAECCSTNEEGAACAGVREELAWLCEIDEGANSGLKEGI